MKIRMEVSDKDQIKTGVAKKHTYTTVNGAVKRLEGMVVDLLVVADRSRTKKAVILFNPDFSTDSAWVGFGLEHKPKELKSGTRTDRSFLYTVLLNKDGIGGPKLGTYSAESLMKQALMDITFADGSPRFQRHTEVVGGKEVFKGWVEASLIRQPATVLSEDVVVVDKPRKEKERVDPVSKAMEIDSKVKAQIKGNIKSLGETVDEVTRIIRECSVHYAGQINNAELLDLNKFEILVTLEAPKNSAGTNSKDRITMGHFTLGNEWTDKKSGKTFRAINLNPFLLESMDYKGIFETCYHEVIHAFNDYLNVGDDPKLQDCGKNGRHKKLFATAADASQLIEAYKVEDYRGYATKLTSVGEAAFKKANSPFKWDKTVPLYYKDLPEAKEKQAPKAKRLALECYECGDQYSQAVGNYKQKLVKVLENNGTFSEDAPAELNPLPTNEDGKVDVQDQILINYLNTKVHLVPTVLCISDGKAMMPKENFQLPL